METRVTAGDIAEKLGLSKSTVMHVLSGRADGLRISQKTQQRVNEAAVELGYRVNLSARATRTGTFGCAALIQPFNSVYLPPEMILAITESLGAHDMYLSVARAPETDDVEEFPKVVRELSADGLLINMITNIPALFLNTVRSLRIPAVWMNTKLDEDCVRPNDLEAGRRGAQHLIDLGHRHIAFAKAGPVFGDSTHYSAAERYMGYEGAMRDAGLEPRIYTIPAGPEWPYTGVKDNRLKEATHLLQATDRATAIVAYELDTALPFLFAAQHAALSVPRDLSLVTFHAELPVEVGFPITTIKQSAWDLGALAVDMLIEKIDNPQGVIPYRTTDVELLLGSTTAPPLLAI